MEQSSFSRLAIPYVVLQACDVFTTLYGLTLGVVSEANPIYHEWGLIGLLSIKTVAVLALLYLAKTAYSLKPRIIRYGFYASSAFLLLVVLNNTVHVALGIAWS